MAPLGRRCTSADHVPEGSNEARGEAVAHYRASAMNSCRLIRSLSAMNRAAVLGLRCANYWLFRTSAAQQVLRPGGRRLARRWLRGLLWRLLRFQCPEDRGDVILQPPFPQN